VYVELCSRRHEPPGRSIDRNPETDEVSGLSRVSESQANAPLWARLAGELATAVSGYPLEGLAGQEQIEFAAEVNVAVVANAIKRRRLASKAAKPLRNDVFDSAKPVRVGLRAINAVLIVRHAIHCHSGRLKRRLTCYPPLTRFESPCGDRPYDHNTFDSTAPSAASRIAHGSRYRPPSSLYAIRMGGLSETKPILRSLGLLMGLAVAQPILPTSRTVRTAARSGCSGSSRVAA
jgi:hypothetical protein